jgi:hypothetical protein
MTVIVIRENAQATWLSSMATVRATARDLARRAIACAAAAIIIGAAGAALVQLAA